MKKLLSALTAAALLCVWTIPCAAALAEDDAGDCVIVYDDSGYQVTELEMATEDSSSPSVFSLSTVTGRKTVTRYDSRDRRLFSFTLTATFSYNGSTASATSASYSYRIYDSIWDFSSGSTRRSRNSAYATGKFSHGWSTKTVTPKLTCSARGQLS